MLKVYIATEQINEGYDCTETTKTKVFATEQLAKKWVSEIRSNNYQWRDYEAMEVIGYYDGCSYVIHQERGV